MAPIIAFYSAHRHTDGITQRIGKCMEHSSCCDLLSECGKQKNGDSHIYGISYGIQSTDSPVFRLLAFISVAQDVQAEIPATNLGKC